MGKAEREAAAAARKARREENNERYRRKMAAADETYKKRMAEIKAEHKERTQPAPPSPASAPARPVSVPFGTILDGAVPEVDPTYATKPVELQFKDLLTVRGGHLELPNGRVQPITFLMATVRWGPLNSHHTEASMDLFGALPLLSKKHRFHHWLTIQPVGLLTGPPVAVLQVDKADKDAARAFADAFNQLPRQR